MAARAFLRAGCAFALILAVALPASAANVVLVNLDPPGTGLNDPTPVAPVGGNPGTTLGEQRTNVYLLAAQIWGSVLDSAVPIFVGATFQPLPCTSGGGTLGAAGPTFAFFDFPGAGFPATWYVSAEADALAGADLAPGNIDIISFFNSDIDDDDPNCLTGRTWYYGFDNNQGGNIDFLTVVLHEIDHGLGHLDLADEATGQLFFGLPDVYVRNMLDLDLGAWTDLTDAERLASQVNSGRLVWGGASVTADASAFLGPAPVVAVEEPEGLGELEAQPAAFGPPFPGGDDDDSDSDSDGGLEGDVVLADDGVGVGSDACEAIVNDVAGKIALIDRGACAFTVKVANAEAAGAIGAIIANNAPGGPTPMGGSNPNIGIVSAGISLADGGALKAALAGDDDDSDSDGEDVEVRFGFSATRLAGTEQGFVRLFAPNPVAPGSSKSHWDTTAEPSLLMEPFITPNLESSQTFDLSPNLLRDIGWPLLP